MKNTWKIAQLQLANLFYSPISWLLLVVIIVQCAISYATVIEFYEEGYRLNRPTLDVTNLLFAAEKYRHKGILFSILESLYLYIPLLTMGLISQELSTGSIKLLLSSPLLFRQVVLGKFMAMIVFALIILACLGLFVVVTGLIVDMPVYSWILSGFFGLFLIMITYMAIGLFISSFSAYQVVSALITFVLLAVLSFIGEFFQDVPVLNDVAFWLSMTDRAEDFVRGLIKSQNVFYFLVLTFLFLVWTIIRLELGKRSLRLISQVSIYSVPLVLTVIIAYLSSLPTLTLYYDATDNKRNTVSKLGQQTLTSLDKYPLKITTYVNIMDDNGSAFLPSGQNSDHRRFERYRRFNPSLKMDYVYFYDSTNYVQNLSRQNPGLDLEELAKKRAISLHLDFNTILSPAEVRGLIDLSSEDNQTIRQFTYGEKKSFSRIFNGLFIYGSDADKIPAFKRLNSSYQLIGFTRGHGERSSTGRDYGDYRPDFSLRHESIHSLLNHGFEVSEINLNEDDLSKVDILVIADPKTAWNTGELAQIQDYLNGGGNMLLLLEKANEMVTAPVLDMLGIDFSPRKLIQHHKGLDSNVIFTYFNKSIPVLNDYFISDTYLKANFPVTMNEATGLTWRDSTNFQIEPFIMFPMSNDTSNQVGVQEMQDLDSLCVALTLQRTVAGKEQRIIVAGDADFISVGELRRKGVSSVNNRGLVKTMFHWLSNYTYPMDLRMPPRRTNNIHFGDQNRALVRKLRMALVGVIPGFLLLFGSIVLIKRNRR